MPSFAMRSGRTFVFTGCGSSYYVGQCAAQLMRALGGPPASAVPSSEIWLLPEMWLREGTVLVAISRTGTTAEVLRALESARAHGIPSVTISLALDVPMHALGDFALPLTHVREAGRVMLQSFSNMLLAAQWLAVAVAQAADSAIAVPYRAGLAQVARAVQVVLPAFDERAREIADEGVGQYVFLGSGPFSGVCAEAVLKVKEMAQVPSESYVGLEYRHGPIATLTPRSVVAIASCRHTEAFDILQAGDVQFLGGRAILVGPEAVLRAAPAGAQTLPLPDDLPPWLHGNLALAFLPIARLPPDRRPGCQPGLRAQSGPRHRSAHRSACPGRSGADPRMTPVVVAIDVGGTSMKGALCTAAGELSHFEQRTTQGSARDRTSSPPSSTLPPIWWMPAASGVARLRPSGWPCRAWSMPRAAWDLVHDPGLARGAVRGAPGGADRPAGGLRPRRADRGPCRGDSRHRPRAGPLPLPVAGHGRGRVDGSSAAGSISARVGWAASWPISGSTGGTPLPLRQVGCWRWWRRRGGGQALRGSAPGRRLVQRARRGGADARGDAAARGVWGRAVAALGRAIAAYVEILEPELVVVGGGMSGAGAALFDPLSALVRAGVSRPDPAPVVPAGLGDLAGLHGAALLAWQRAGPDDT